MLMGRSWIPFASRRSQLCAVVAASPPLSYDHAKRGPDDGDGEWRSYERYQTGEIRGIVLLHIMYTMYGRIKTKRRRRRQRQVLKRDNERCSKETTKVCRLC